MSTTASTSTNMINSRIPTTKPVTVSRRHENRVVESSNIPNPRSEVHRGSRADTFLKLQGRSSREHVPRDHGRRLSEVLDRVAAGRLAAPAAIAQLKVLCAEFPSSSLSLETLQGAYEVALTDSPFLSKTSFPLKMLGPDLPDVEMATGKLYCEFVGDRCHEWSRTTLPIKDEPPLHSYLSLVSRVRDVCADRFTLDHLEMWLWCGKTETTRKTLWHQRLGDGEPVRITPMPRPGMVTRVDWFDGEFLVGGFEQSTTVLRRVGKSLLDVLA